jgi:hypothetical protein
MFRGPYEFTNNKEMCMFKNNSTAGYKSRVSRTQPAGGNGPPNSSPQQKKTVKGGGYNMMMTLLTTKTSSAPSL